MKQSLLLSLSVQLCNTRRMLSLQICSRLGNVPRIHGTFPNLLRHSYKASAKNNGVPFPNMFRFRNDIFTSRLSQSTVSARTVLNS